MTTISNAPNCMYMMPEDFSVEMKNMLSGELYDANDKKLRKLRLAMQGHSNVLRDYNVKLSHLSENQKMALDLMRFRKQLLQKIFYSTGKNVHIESPFYADYGCFISLGENFYANFNCCILDGGGVEIGDDVMFGPGVQIYTAHHPMQSDIRHGCNGHKALELCHRVRIGNRVWIGGNAIVNPSVTIGDDVVIGSGSVVTKDIPSGSVVAGNPARIIRTLGAGGCGSEEDEVKYLRRRTSAAMAKDASTYTRKEGSVLGKVSEMNALTFFGVVAIVVPAVFYIGYFYGTLGKSRSRS